MATELQSEYDITLDSRKRFTLRGNTPFNRYHVRHFSDGRVVAEPRVLAAPEELSENTRKMIYASLRNLKKGKAGTPIDFTKYSKYLKDDQE